jgi:transposase
MTSIRKKHGSRTKAKVALEAIKSDQTLSELGRRFGVHGMQVGKWRRDLIERAHELFEDGRSKTSSPEESVEELLVTIGRLKVENDFLKKKSGLN